MQTPTHNGSHHLVGMRSRGVFETPGRTILSIAHRDREHPTVDAATMRQNDHLAHTSADLVSNGHPFSLLRVTLDAFVATTQQPVAGGVRLKRHQGPSPAVGRHSPVALDHEHLATFVPDDVDRQADADGFIRLDGLGHKVAAHRDRHAKHETEVAR